MFAGSLEGKRANRQPVVELPHEIGVITSYSIHYTKLYDAVRRSERRQVCRVARRVRMALGQDPQVAHEPVVVLHGVLEEEAVADVVVGHVVLDAQEVP